MGTNESVSGFEQMVETNSEEEDAKVQHRTLKNGRNSDTPAQTKQQEYQSPGWSLCVRVLIMTHVKQ